MTKDDQIAALKRGNTELINALMLMADQYCTDNDGKFSHMFMSAGEACEEVLEECGMILPEGKLAWGALEKRKDLFR